MADPYEINVDPDLANKDNLTFFINYKVYDYNNRFIGAAGVGLTVDAVIKLIDKYQQRYQRSVYFVDNFGRLVLTGAEGGPQGARIGQTLGELDSMKEPGQPTAQTPQRQLRIFRPGPGTFPQRAVHSGAELVPVRRQTRRRRPQ